MSEFSWAEGVRRVAVFTGAGISTDSGVPDYRGPQGIWTKNPELADLFTFDNFVSDPGVRARYWQVFAERRRDVEPNAAHRALAELERAGTALRIITQNVDGLHQKAGSTPRKVVELHGTLATAVCLECRTEVPSAEAVARLPEEPVCACGGLLKPSVVMFGEYLDPEVLAEARGIAAASELFLAVGSSLRVEPAAGLCALAVRSGARLVIVNRDPTPYDDLAAELVREPIGTVLPRICDALAKVNKI